MTRNLNACSWCQSITHRIVTREASLALPWNANVLMFRLMHFSEELLEVHDGINCLQANTKDRTTIWSSSHETLNKREKALKWDTKKKRENIFVISACISNFLFRLFPALLSSVIEFQIQIISLSQCESETPLSRLMGVRTPPKKKWKKSHEIFESWVGFYYVPTNRLIPTSPKI